jgi:hypothetical protein
VSVTPEKVLLKRFSDFISKRSRGLDDIIQTADIFRARGWTAFSFGGIPRGVYDAGNGYKPRDIDLVFDDEHFRSFQSAYAHKTLRRNSYGGIKVRINNLIIDAWPLSATWAFRNGFAKTISFETLPSTTFLNVDGIIIELIPKKWKRRRYYETGFFSGLHDKTLDINLAANPYPSICVVRTLHIAKQFGFRLSRSLAIYLKDMMSRIVISSFLEAQLKHYGEIEFQPLELNRVRWIIEQYLETDTSPTIGLFPVRAEQRQLWDFNKLLELNSPYDLFGQTNVDPQMYSEIQQAQLFQNLFEDTKDIKDDINRKRGDQYYLEMNESGGAISQRHSRK